ncbi:NUDIX hydrolase [Poritiphilus flavus]|uniref:NUDIX domain-containing protein n=1 Tax=Poritiphilus flavus TaxID=2697053 RepID=A0A6L9EAP5_9FLAO|nr:NUDIX domain-containing protein [Poritiphilus flavus]NAS11734.1 NUDIX domain-containing protein [Poritiphilus flavus]
MDELIDILDENGRPTGKTAMKSEAHKKGWPHPTVHIWFYTANGQVLLQQRGEHKDTHPLLWDVSVAGHIGAGEEARESAVRETQEEIGLKISEADLEPIGVFKSYHEHREDLIDFEFHHTFLAELKVPLSSLRKQQSEVESLDLVPLMQLAEEVWGLANPQKYVPHEVAYYKQVIRSIKQRL